MSGFSCLGRSDEAGGREGGLCIIGSHISATPSSPGWPGSVSSWQGVPGLGTGFWSLSPRAQCRSPSLLWKPFRHSWLLLWAAALQHSHSVPHSGQACKLPFSQKRQEIPFPLPADFLEHLEKFKMLFNVQIHEIEFFILKQ